MDQEDETGDPQTSKSNRDKFSRVSGIIYVSIMLLSAIGWIIYFKCYRKKHPKVEGFVWSRQQAQIQDQSYYTIVPGSPKRPECGPPALELPMPGLVYSVTENYKDSSGYPIAPSYKTSAIAGPKY